MLLHRKFLLMSAAGFAASAGGFSTPVSPFPVPDGAPLKTPIAAAAAEVAASVPEVASAAPGDVMAPASEAEMEKLIQAKGLTAPRLTPDHIQAVIVDETYTRLEGTRTTVCRLELANGFCVVGVNNGPVSAANFDQDIGCQYAYKAAVDQIWPLEGYLLAERLFRAATEDEKVAKLRDLLATQRTVGTIDQGEYLRGMANGMALALSVFDGQEPDFAPAPQPPEDATHVANPVHVTAAKILDVGGHDVAANSAMLRLSDGRNYLAGAEQCAQHWPVAGDYMIFLNPTDHYICPADVFARKYRAV